MKSQVPAVPTAQHYQSRIAKFAARLEPKSVAIIASNPEQTRSNDTEYPYRQSSDMLYLNGFDEPESVLVITNIGDQPASVVMFVRAKDASREQWTGIRAGVEGAKSRHLAREAFTIDKFAEVMGPLIARADNVYYRAGRNDEANKFVASLLAASPRTQRNPEDILHEMRMFKTEEEIALMDEAARISAQAHCAAARRCAPGLSEYHLQATLEFVFTDNGAQAPAYGSIVANGGSGWVLHYVSNRGELKDGDMVLIDAAAEYHGYAADITRTFPVSGKFSEPQREIYQLVLDAQLAAIAAAKPGATLAQVHQTAADTLKAGLVKLGLLPSDSGSTPAPSSPAARGLLETLGVVSPAVSLSTFFPHGTSHWIGLDVHDVGSNGTRSDRGKDRKLEPGMCFTVEPGLYFGADDTRVPEKYRGIAVRIEDDVLITADGGRVLTAGVPKEVSEIEQLMAKN
jgi:Xaa-Pro aminopeptidase